MPGPGMELVGEEEIDEYNLFLIEDCAQAFGASYKGRPIGSIGHVGAFSFNVYKTITSGDGGMVITDDEELYKRCFAFHDQGHSPLRAGAEIGHRPFLGLDFRYTELQAAVLLAQLRKLPTILDRLRTNKQQFKALLADLPGLEFREIIDPEEELGAMLTVFFPNAEIAQQVAQALNTKVIAQAGWHVYGNMEHLLQQRLPTQTHCSFSCPTTWTGTARSATPRACYRRLTPSSPAPSTSALASPIPAWGRPLVSLSMMGRRQCKHALLNSGASPVSTLSDYEQSTSSHHDQQRPPRSATALGVAPTTTA
ncbi:MAG: hypothetical protein DYG89_42760 [Caldilinea sp. CFX5]|nr:hypothetical protein [Caldilinea sp. CFX5]